MSSVLSQEEIMIRSDFPLSFARPNKTVYALEIHGEEAGADLIEGGRCGSAHSEFTYNIAVKSYDLDGSGFVLDNRIKDKIATLYEDPKGKSFWHASCELLAAGLIAFVISEMGDREPIEIQAEVYNSTGKVSVKWSQGQPIPQGPKRATDRENKAELVRRSSSDYRDEGRAAC